MSQAKVSDSFTKFYQRSARAVEEAKKAENTMMTCAMPIGYKGQCVLINATASMSKEKKDSSGKLTQESRPTVIFEFSVIGDEKYTGKKFSRVWQFYDDEKVTTQERFEWFLNNCQSLGVSDELRKNHSDMEELLNFFLESNLTYSYEVQEAKWNKNDGKTVVVSLPQRVDESDSTMPGAGKEKIEIEVGKLVTYMGASWRVMDIEGDDITIKSEDSNQKKIVGHSDLS